MKVYVYQDGQSGQLFYFGWKVSRPNLTYKGITFIPLRDERTGMELPVEGS